MKLDAIDIIKYSSIQEKISRKIQFFLEKNWNVHDWHVPDEELDNLFSSFTIFLMEGKVESSMKFLEKNGWVFIQESNPDLKRAFMLAKKILLEHLNHNKR